MIKRTGNLKMLWVWLFGGHWNRRHIPKHGSGWWPGLFWRIIKYYKERRHRAGYNLIDMVFIECNWVVRTFGRMKTLMRRISS